MFVYKMVPLAPVIVAKKKDMNEAAAKYLQDKVNQQAAEGWEFVRVDSFTAEEAQGCLSFGKAERVTHYVASFRKPTNAQ